LLTSTPEYFFNHQLTIFQPEKGYRFSLDPVLLAGHVDIKGRETILDIGTGCGILMLMLLFKHPGITAIGVEIQQELADIAQKNLKINLFQSRGKIVCRDIKKTKLSDIKHRPDIIVANPPYKKRNTGRINPDPEKALARHEIAMTLEDLAYAVNRLLAPGGTSYIIYPAERTAELVFMMQSCCMSPVSLQFVYTGKDRCAKLVMFKGIKQTNAPLTILPPFYTDTLYRK